MLNRSLDHAFQALGDPTRRAIVARLASGPLSVSELARPLPMSLPAVLQHLAVLENAGLVASAKAGRVRTCRLETAAIAQAEQWLSAQRGEWERRLDRLADYLKHNRSPRMNPEPIEISRVFDAPRERVFAAWSTSERIARWFSPEGCSVPSAEIDFRRGGAFVVTMRLPDGQDNLCHGAFDEVTPPSRLAFTMEVEIAGKPRFRVHTTVDFAAEGEATRMTVRQNYVLHDADFAAAPASAREGWRTTLDKLARELSRAPAAHGAFTITRALPHAPAVVYRAFADPQAKARWFAGGGELTVLARELDVRVGGREIAKARWKNGNVSAFEAVYLDVVPEARLVYAYTLHLNERMISVSLATVEFAAAGGGCELRITEQGAFLDGYEDKGAREHGTRQLIELMAATL